MTLLVPACVCIGAPLYRQHALGGCVCGGAGEGARECGAGSEERVSGVVR